ncbi:MAG: carbon-nitrogen hydrolase family protein [Micromonosporaceae bacterium]|nr:carbon-nitrogen hydrolase family protein [Micromonosporaceae bacterium]
MTELAERLASEAEDSAAPDRLLRVAAVQAEAAPGEVALNAITAARLIRQAGERGAALAVFPELFLPAYCPPELAARPERCDVPVEDGDRVPDLRLDPIRAAVRDAGVVAVIGASTRRPDGARRCSALVADRAGEIRAAYDKQHLCGRHEKDLFSLGEQGCTIEVDSWRLGIGICYDGCFPEHARAAVLAGAHAYICPSGYVVGSHPRRNLYYRARALDNTSYVVFANPVGGGGDWRFNGGAAIYDPQGQPIEKAPDEGEAIVVADLDPKELLRVRAAHAMLVDRRDDLTQRVFQVIA